MAHIHEIKDAETHFIIDATTREISNAGVLPALVQGDHNSEVFTFVAPRFVDNHDLSTCNKVKVHYLNIDSITRKPYADIYEVDDLHIDETDTTKVVFTWLISRYSTQNVGLLNFAIEYTCEKDGVIDYSWNTAIFTGINVKAGINNAAQIMTEYTDILEKWKQDVIKELTQNGNSHEHNNKNTLDAFSCDALDNPITDGDFNFGINTEDWNRLKFQDDTVLMASDGAVVRNVEVKEDDNGNKFFRMHFNKPGLDISPEPMTSFVDIPINGTNDKFDFGLDSGGLELELPTGSEGGIPAVHELPIDAKEGDLCLYAPMNSLTLTDSGKRIYIDWEKFKEPSQTNDPNNTPVCQFNADEGGGFITIECAKGNLYDPFCSFSIMIDPYSTETDINFSCGIREGVLEYGVLEIGDEITTYNTIDELPKYFQIPQFNTIYNLDFYGDIHNEYFFHTEYRLMKYQGGEWVEAVEIATNRITSAGGTSTILPNTDYSFGECESLTITFAEGKKSKRNEYIFSFTSGATPTVLTLPDTVKWANELTVEANKRYEISIVDNIGLWCAVEVTE